MRVGVDTGGTFTDVVTDAGEVRKLPSTPGNPSRAVVDGCTGLGTATPMPRRRRRATRSRRKQSSMNERTSASAPAGSPCTACAPRRDART